MFVQRLLNSLIFLSRLHTFDKEISSLSDLTEIWRSVFDSERIIFFALLRLVLYSLTRSAWFKEFPTSFFSESEFPAERMYPSAVSNVYSFVLVFTLGKLKDYWNTREMMKFIPYRSTMVKTPVLS